MTEGTETEQSIQTWREGDSPESNGWEVVGPMLEPGPGPESHHHSENSGIQGAVSYSVDWP